MTNNKLPRSLQTRVAAASLTIQQLVTDVMLALTAEPETNNAQDVRRLRGQRVDGSRPGVSPEGLQAFLDTLVTGPGRYRPGADAVAYGVAKVSGHEVEAIATFFGVEAGYVIDRLSRLVKQARRAPAASPDSEAEGPAGAEAQRGADILEIFADAQRT